MLLCAAALRMRWEEYRQKKSEIYWAAREAEERECMFHEDPRRQHEAGS